MKNPNKDQFSLFSEPSEPTARHDYGGGTPDEAGHEFPFVKAGESPTDDVGTKEGVSVSLRERAATLTRAAEIYANYNKLTVGLGKAALIPEEIAKLNERYGENQVPGVVAGARVNSFYGPAPSDIDINNPTGEMRMLEGVLKTRELLASGEFSKTDIEADLQPLIVGIRHAIGTADHGVRAKERQAELKKVNASAARAREYGDR